MTTAYSEGPSALDKMPGSEDFLPPLTFILRNDRLESCSLIHADVHGMRLTPQPEANFDDFFLAHLGFLPPERSRARARAWISARARSHMHQVRLRSNFLNELLAKLDQLSVIA